VDDLLPIAELHIVDLKHVHVVGLQAPERLIYTLLHAARGEIKIRKRVAAALRGQENLIALALQGAAEPFLGQREAIERRHIKVVDATIDGAVNGPDSLGLVGLSEDVSQRRNAEGQD